MKRLILASGLLILLTSYSALKLDKRSSKNSNKTKFALSNSHLTMSATVQISNIDYKLLSYSSRRTIANLERDTTYDKINFSPSSKMTKPQFSKIVEEYRKTIKKLKNDGFYRNGVNGIGIADSINNDFLYYEYNWVDIVNDSINCLLRVNIVFEGEPPVKDGPLKVLDIQIFDKKQKAQFSEAEKAAIRKKLTNFGTVPPPPSTK